MNFNSREREINTRHQWREKIKLSSNLTSTWRRTGSVYSTHTLTQTWLLHFISVSFYCQIGQMMTTTTTTRMDRWYIGHLMKYVPRIVIENNEKSIIYLFTGLFIINFNVAKFIFKFPPKNGGSISRNSEGSINPCARWMRKKTRRKFRLVAELGKDGRELRRKKPCCFHSLVLFPLFISY